MEKPFYKKTAFKIILAVLLAVVPVIVISAAGAVLLREKHFDADSRTAADTSVHGALNDSQDESDTHTAQPSVLHDDSSGTPAGNDANAARQANSYGSAVSNTQNRPWLDGSSDARQDEDAVVDDSDSPEPSETPGQNSSKDAEEEQQMASKISVLVNTGSGSGTDKVAYLTFDDGPSRSITPAILDALMEEGIKATFFVVGRKGVDDIYQRILDEGHEIGNHSYSHVYSKLYNADDIQPFIDDVESLHDFIQDGFGYTMVSFRFPGGAMGRRAAIVEPRAVVLTVMGYRCYDWNVITGDADNRQWDKSAEALTANVLDNTRGRAKLIVLMHDSGDKATTLEALPYIIEGLRDQGYQFDVLLNYE